MPPQKATYLNYGISIIFAIAMISSSFFLGDDPNKQTVVFLLLAAWFVPFIILSRISAKKTKKES